MNKKLFINFHDLIGLEISSHRERFLSYFASEYEHYLSKGLGKDIPRVGLRIESRDYPFNDAVEFTSQIHKVLARWKYHVKVQDGLINIRAGTNFIGLSMIHHMLVHPSVRYLSAKQRVLMLHAGAVCLKENSVLITGPGGTGKTTTTSLLLSQSGADYFIHADDYVFVDHLHSLSYMTRSHLYHDILNWVPEISSRLTMKEKVKLKIFGLLREWSSGGLKWPTRISANRLWPKKKLCNQGEIRGLVFLSKEESIEKPQLVQVQDMDRIRNAILNMNFSEAEHFINLLEKDHSVRDINEWLEEWRSLEEHLLKRLLDDVPLFQLRLPTQGGFSSKYKDLVVEKFERLIKSTGSSDVS